MSFSDIISSLFSSVPPAVQKEPTAFQPPEEVLYSSQPTNYPSHEDAQFAKKYDYSYGQPWAPEFNDQIYHILASGPNDRPLKIESYPQDAIMRSKQANKDIPDYYARAALAAQNSGLAMLGFDPKRAALDVWRDPNKVNIAGTYTPSTDQIYSNQQHVSNIVHESIHRGIEKLSQTPYWQKEWNGVPEEYIVRALMTQRMGNPEQKYIESILGNRVFSTPNFSDNGGGFDQISAANKMFGTDKGKALLDQIDMAASNYLAAKHPGGPR